MSARSAFRAILFREMLESCGDRISIAALVAIAIRKAREAGDVIVTSFDKAGVVSASADDLETLGGARLLVGISRRLGSAAHG